MWRRSVLAQRPARLSVQPLLLLETAGGGYALNLGGEAASLKAEGEENLSVYQAAQGDGVKSPARRHFCRLCGSALWLWDSRWPALIHPFASAVDTELPIPPERTHLMVASKARWVSMQAGPKDQVFDHYPQESIAAWHARLGLQSYPSPFRLDRQIKLLVD